MQHMNIAIVGFDTEGRATYEFLRDKGHDITVCDQKADLELPEGVTKQLGDGYLDGLDRFDQIVRTPGLHPAKILAVNPSVGGKITSHLNLFLENCPTNNIIGVTGTKGKGTTSTLITNMLQADGKQVFLGGNIGVPPLTFLPELTNQSHVVLELSSFQLIDLKQSPHIATCLMVVPEHLDWHEDFEEYLAAKQQLFIHQNSDDVAIYYAGSENSLSIADASEGKLVPYFEKPGAVVENGQIVIDGQIVCVTSELKLLGEHNWQNACAAVTTIWQVTQNIDAMRSVLTTFSGLPFRLEFVREVGGVMYYNDSFGTTPETAIVAMQAFNQPKVVILGGSDKGASYDQLAEAVAKANVRHAVLIGTEADKIKVCLDKVGFTNYTTGLTTMPQMVAELHAKAQPGDIALLSTGCASFGLFKNYKDRGNQFTEAVQAL